MVFDLTHGQRHDSLLSMQAILGLVPGTAMRAIKHTVGYLNVAVRRQRARAGKGRGSGSKWRR